MNTYFRHPSNQSNPGSQCPQDNSIEQIASYWRWIAANRFADRPFIFTEFNHAFWNRYQHENGILFGAYSALQDIDAMVIHCNAVVSKVERNDAWSVGSNPIARANEYLSTCLFLRQDVKSSPNRIEVEIPTFYLEKEGYSGVGISAETPLALISGFTILFPDVSHPEGLYVPKEADLILNPTGAAKIKEGDWYAEIEEEWDVGNPIAKYVEQLKKTKILDSNNCTDPSRGVYESDTGEIKMRANEKLLKVITPCSEAVSLDKEKGESLKQLVVKNTSVPALVAACSADGETLDFSNRIVLIYATDTVNNNMEVSGDRVRLFSLGELPILLRTGNIDITLKNHNADKMELYALGLDGARLERLPLKVENGVMHISIKTSTLKHGPSVFFELVTE